MPDQHPPPLFELSPEELRAALEEVHRQSLIDLSSAAEANTRARADLDGAVSRARAAGASWGDIGRACGMARSSARERWSR